MRFAHLSDLHLCEDPAADRDAGRHAADIATAMAQDVAKLGQILDFVVVSGDLTDDAHDKSFQSFERLFAPLELPVFTIPGNHDGPAAYRSQAASGWLARCDITGRSIDLGHIRLLGLDTCIENSTTGALSKSTLERVETELASNNSRQLVIVMHHPPFTTGHGPFDAIAELEGRAEFARLIAESRPAPIILCGHIHRIYQANWHGAACYIAGSPALPYISDMPFGSSPIRPALEDLVYFVHAIDEQSTHIATPQRVHRPKAPID